MRQHLAEDRKVFRVQSDAGSDAAHHPRPSLPPPQQSSAAASISTSPSHPRPPQSRPTAHRENRHEPPDQPHAADGAPPRARRRLSLRLAPRRAGTRPRTYADRCRAKSIHQHLGATAASLRPDSGASAPARSAGRCRALRGQRGSASGDCASGRGSGQRPFVVAVFFVWSGEGWLRVGAAGGSHRGVGSESERACQIGGLDRFDVASLEAWRAAGVLLPLILLSLVLSSRFPFSSL